MADNIIRPSVTEQVQTKTLQNSYIDHMNASNRLDDRTPYDGTLDRYGELRLRIAVIDNHEIKRQQYSKIDPLDTKEIVNLNTGCVVLRWLDMPGGIIRDANTAGKWEHNKKYEHTSVNKHENIDESTNMSNTSDPYILGMPENRNHDEWNITSRREMVELTHPFMWSSIDNYCGMNYLPPVGSVVIVGFKKHGLPIILGYVPTNYTICKPILKPGEITMKGYGNNYIHWRQSDKLDMKVWAEKDGKDGKKHVDNDDYENAKVNKADCTMWLRMNANDRYIMISAEGENPDDSKNHKTNLVIKPESITVNTTGTFKVNAGNIELNANSGDVIVKGNKIFLNSGG